MKCNCKAEVEEMNERNLKFGNWRVALARAMRSVHMRIGNVV